MKKRAIVNASNPHYNKGLPSQLTELLFMVDFPEPGLVCEIETGFRQSSQTLTWWMPASRFFLL